MSVSQTWTNPGSLPPDLTNGQTLTQTAWEDVLSNLDWLGGSDGSHGWAMTFQNSADKGKRFQRGVTASVTTTIASGSVFYNNATLSWASTFGATPGIQATAAAGATLVWAMGNSTTTTASMTLIGSTNADASTIEVWGIG